MKFGGTSVADAERIKRAAERVAARASTRKPLIVKLTPNTANVPACAAAAQEGGADAVSLINTLRAMALSPMPMLNRNSASV